MKIYKSKMGLGSVYILGITLGFDLLIVLLINNSNSFVISSLLKFTLLVFNIYQIYYLILYSTIRYEVNENILRITGIFRLIQTEIKFSDIQAYKTSHGYIKGVKLTGYGNNFFAIGKSVIDKIGTTNMFLTSDKNILYLKTEEINIAISPELSEEFENLIIGKGINKEDWTMENYNKHINLYKDKYFIIPFFIASIIVLFLIFNPFILYLFGKLPMSMPLNFNSAFEPIKLGTGKQFALNQMAYGILNMAMLFCMYYASYFYAKYDRKSSYKFIYISLFISIIFFIIQIRILFIR